MERELFCLVHEARLPVTFTSVHSSLISYVIICPCGVGWGCFIVTLNSRNSFVVCNISMFVCDSLERLNGLF